MNEITLEEVDHFTSGNYKNTPKCSQCLTKNCYIIIDSKKVENGPKTPIFDQFWLKNDKNALKTTQIFKNRYFYSATCKNCVQYIHHEYITDEEVMKFIENHCISEQKCVDCRKNSCFIRINTKGKYFTKKCSSCIGVRNL